MKTLIGLCILGSILTCAAGAQETPPPLKKGVSVQMPVADHVVEMRDADAQNATVVAITAEGKIYAGIEPVEPAALSKLTADTIYVKADSRVPYQKVLTVLDALRGKSVVLIASPTSKNAEKAKYVPPYGIKLTVPR